MQTWTEEWTQARARIAMTRLLHKVGIRWDTLRDTLEQSLEGYYLKEKLDSVGADQASIAGLNSAQTYQQAWAPHLAEFALIADIPEQELTQIVIALRERYMVTNNHFVKSRNITFGTPAAVTGTGTWAVRRLTVDAQGQALEGVFLEDVRVECIADQGGAQKHEELIEFRGEAAQPDFTTVDGSGMQLRVNLISGGPAYTQRYVNNPSFSIFTGTAPTAGVPSTPTATDQVSGWVLTTIANARIQLDRVYRGFPGDTVPYALRFTGNNKIVQTLETQRRPQFNRSIPIYVQVAVYRASSADGNFILRWGAVTITVDLTTLVDSAWNIVQMTIGVNNWYDTFKEDGMTLEYEWASRTTGEIDIDDGIVSPFYNIAGTWFAPVGGATPALRGDYTTYTDALVGADGLFQYSLWRAGLGYLRSTVDATQVTASGGRTLTFAAAGFTCTASSGSWVTDGYKVGMNVTFAGTSSNNTTLRLTNVSATVLTFASGIANEGPLSATATVNATADITDPAETTIS